MTQAVNLATVGSNANSGGTLITSGTVNAGGANPFNNTLSSIDFTNIPSWVKRITVMFNGVSLSGSANIRLQLGVSGTPEITGYLSGSTLITGAPATSIITSTAGIELFGAVATYAINGSLIFTTLGNNIWTAMGVTYNTTTVPYVQQTAGSKTLAGVLNMVRITTTGSDTFDAGSINILYE